MPQNCLIISLLVFHKYNDRQYRLLKDYYIRINIEHESCFMIMFCGELEYEICTIPKLLMKSMVSILQQKKTQGCIKVLGLHASCYHIDLDVCGRMILEMVYM